MTLSEISKNIFEIKDFLTPGECQELIAFAESSGFAEADVALPNDRRQQLNHIRNNSRVNESSLTRAQQWWQKLEPLSLPIFSGASAVGCSPYFRYYKYQTGQKFNMHKDGRQTVNGNQTLFTMLVYLNAEYCGGETVFRQDQLVIKPEVGKAVIFDHHLWHKGSILETGIKYVLRTDIEYKANTP